MLISRVGGVDPIEAAGERATLHHNREREHQSVDAHDECRSAIHELATICASRPSLSYHEAPLQNKPAAAVTMLARHCDPRVCDR